MIERVLAENPLIDQGAPGLRSILLRMLLAACDAAGDAERGVAAADDLLSLTNSVVWRPAARRLRAKFQSGRGANA